MRQITPAVTIWCEMPRQYLLEHNAAPENVDLDFGPDGPKHILIILTDRIGDAFNSLYFLANIRRLFPQAKLSYISQAFGDATFMRRIMGAYADDIYLAEVMSEQDFIELEPDVIFDLNPIASLFPYYPAQHAARIGHHEKCDIVVPQPQRNWKANDHLNILRVLNLDVEYRYPPIPLSLLHDRRLVLGLPSRPYIALCFEATAKSWMLDDDVVDGLLRYMLDKTDYEICIVGGDLNNHGIFPTITSDRIHNYTGRRSLTQAIGILAGAESVVTVDTGLMHAASYLGRPTAAIFTCGDPGKNGPQGQRGRVAVQAVCMDPPTGVWEKRDDLQSGIERAFLRLDHVVEVYEALLHAPETEVAERVMYSIDAASLQEVS